VEFDESIGFELNALHSPVFGRNGQEAVHFATQHGCQRAKAGGDDGEVLGFVETGSLARDAIVSGKQEAGGEGKVEMSRICSLRRVRAWNWKRGRGRTPVGHNVA
jgi:hypothetical protein